MNIVLTPTASSHFLYCSSDKKTYIYDDLETQTRTGVRGSEERYDFIMKDGTKNTLQRALSRLNPTNKSYLCAKYNLSNISLESAQAENLMADLFNGDIISEDEMNMYTLTNDEPILITKTGNMGRVPDEPNIYQVFKQLAKEKQEKAHHLQGEQKEKVLKKAEMYSRLAGILKDIFGEIEGMVRCGDYNYHTRLEDLNSPYASDEKNGELIKSFLNKTEDEINDSLDKMVTPRESAEERRRRLELWEKEHLYLEIKNNIQGN